MNALTHTPRRPGRRIAELDPFAAEAGLETEASYGCVDWFAYGEDEPRAQARAPWSGPGSATTGLPGATLPAQPARSLRH